MKKIVLNLFLISFICSLYASDIKVYQTFELPRTSFPTYIVYDPNTNLMWQDQWNIIKKGNGKTWHTAKNHCKNMTYSGYSDWRLPKAMEALRIIDHTKYNPSTKKGFKNIGIYDIWVEESYKLDSKKAFVVNLYHGYRKTETKVSLNQVTCVRENIN